MDAGRITAEYLRRRALLESLTKEVNGLKEMLSDIVDAEGVPDENGHLWFTAGDYLLKRQKAQPQKYLDPNAAEQWVRDKGIWDDVKVVKEVLDTDALLGWVFEHRAEPGLEAAFEELYVTPDPTWSFIKPVEQKQYEY